MTNSVQNNLYVLSNKSNGATGQPCVTPLHVYLLFTVDEEGGEENTNAATENGVENNESSETENSEQTNGSEQLNNGTELTNGMDAQTDTDTQTDTDSQADPAEEKPKMKSADESSNEVPETNGICDESESVGESFHLPLAYEYIDLYFCIIVRGLNIFTSICYPSHLYLK